MKLDPQIYVKAAEMVASAKPEDHEASCNAIMIVGHGPNWGGDDWDSSRERDSYNEFFAPYKEYFKNPAYWFNSGNPRVNQYERVLALLFMSQIAKDL